MEVVHDAVPGIHSTSELFTDSREGNLWLKVFSEKYIPILPFCFKVTGYDLTISIAQDLNIDRASLHIISKSMEIGEAKDTLE
jgi:hypothetical protein